MRKILVLFLIIALLLICAAASVLLARGWFTLRTANVAPPPPTVEAFGVATPTLAALAPADGGAGATPAAPAPVNGAAGGFNGSFSGMLNGDGGSSAPATIVLTQTGNDVAGRLSIGSGLALDAGSCGVQGVPSGDQVANGTVDPANPSHLETTGSIEVSGFTIGVLLSADLSADGRTLNARADLDLPFICGSDPVISGTFAKE